MELHTDRAKIVDENGREVVLTGVNWFGFETSNRCPHGLWSRDYKGVLMQIKQMGFNCIRLPFSDKILEPGSMPSSISFYGTDPFVSVTNGKINQELQGKTSLEILDIIMSKCKELSLAVILDNHSRDPDGYMNEKVWYTADVSEDFWIRNWVSLVQRYKDNDALVGCDLDNEPHGKPSDGGSTWGTGIAASDWRLAAERCGNAILLANPRVLIVVEGVEQVGSDGYWWGGNLSGARPAPVRLSNPKKLVYSAHDYGPEVFVQTWFDDPSFPSNLAAVWDAHFGYIVKENIAPVLIGEFGIRDNGSYSGKEGTWFKTLLAYLRDRFSWTFWCYNPNSGDTGGLLEYDWLTTVKWKLDLLAPYCKPVLPFSGTAGVEHLGSPGIHKTPDCLVTTGNREILVHSEHVDRPVVVEIIDARGVHVSSKTIEKTGMSRFVVSPGMYIAKIGPRSNGNLLAKRITVSQ
jgi:aryl-phospho-beta-D-glucosidase BglC (GH1 family)